MEFKTLTLVFTNWPPNKQTFDRIKAKTRAKVKVTITIRFMQNSKNYSAIQLILQTVITNSNVSNLTWGNFEWNRFVAFETSKVVNVTSIVL